MKADELGFHSRRKNGWRLVWWLHGSTVFSATWKRPPPATARKISLAQSWAQLSQDLDKLLPLLVFNSDNKQEIVEEKDIPPL